MKTEIVAPAKINLTLDIFGKRENGYHEISSVMQKISIYDRITVSESKREGIHITTNVGYVPTDERNLCYKAARLYFEEAGITGNVDIDIRKKIPVAAGLAGGSSDAAAVLKALEAIYGALSDRLCSIAPKIGADVAFCLADSPCLCTGIGEILTPLESRAAGIHVVAAKNVRGLSTPYMYSKYDELGEGAHSDTNAVIKALAKGSAGEIAPLLHNDFEKAAFLEKPEIKRLKNRFLESGALGALMSGSGPTVFGIFSSGKEASDFGNKLYSEGIQTFTARFI